MLRHTTNGNVFLYKSTPMAWRSKLQKMIAQSLSTVEAEYYAQSCAAVKVIYFNYLLTSVPSQWGSRQLDICLSLRTTPRASSGETTSSEDKSVQNYCKSRGRKQARCSQSYQDLTLVSASDLGRHCAAAC